MADSLKIMQACGAPGPGGAQNFFLRLVAALHAHPDTLVMPVVRTHSWLAERLNAEGIPFETASFGGRLDFLTRPKLAHLIRSFKPHVAQTWMNRASRFMPRDMVPTVGRLGGYYDLKYYQGLDYLLGNTEDICRYIRECGWPTERTRYMPNFVTMPEKGFKSQGEAIRAHRHIPDNVPVLLLAGRLHTNKGFDVALKALAHLPNHLHVLIAGEGEEEATLRAIAESVGATDRVHFLGWVNQVSPLCAAADIFVVPSRREPLGNVVLEGWAHAMPVVAANAAGPEQLITNGEDGLLVPMEDDVALAEAINHVISDPAFCSKLAEQGLDTLMKNFSQEAVVNKHLQFYRSIQTR